MTATPTAPDRPFHRDGFATLTEALDFAARGPTGINLYGLRGELIEAIPYGELRTRARAMAARFLAAGLKPHDRVGLVADTDVDFVVAFFACQYARITPAPLPLPTPLGGRDAYVEQIGRMLASASAAAVFGAETLLPWLQDAAKTAGTRIAMQVSDLPEAPPTDLPAPTPDDPSYVQFSSGSTRNPTGVLCTHRALMANALASTRGGLQVTADDRAISWLPLYHDMGLVGFLLMPMSAQMSIDLMPTGAFVRRPLLWLDILSKNGGTISYSPSFGYELCAKRGDGTREGLDLTKWRIAGCGGDMVRPGPLTSFAERYEAAGFRATAFVASYGMAEATLGLSMSPLDTGLIFDTVDVDRMEKDGAVTPGSGERSRAFVRCGAIFEGHELEVRDETGALLPERRVGRLFARGPSLMREYYGDPQATAAVLSRDGWLDTGDLGYLADGQIVPTGRAKDLILLNGRNVWPQDLEWTAESEIERLRSGDVAAFSVDQDAGEQLVVLVQARSSDPEVRQALTGDVAAVLRARHGVEAKVELVGAHALPQTSSGKLSRSKARTLFLAGAFNQEEPA
ncbi:MAG: fatty acyl-AMP ligase [Alphaproteobacteria bacterium]|nr:fatty acyl-AMP ligase [Alphaproteobacteria bacterium]MBU1516949.1 fatty acyl-AMP ligase [Alphaproteobacteria bacterium]MBU2095837.1 fatty acyl-AMP ligase [Alphaproteobacteria bacterium]MBU2152026.1 fatty acyl-AMP ligase [Alphaproteobacteria bacterium]MBU2309547.1 fatty acyl-AMP ligase [Alphaproteobacteria bacterium]